MRPGELPSRQVPLVTCVRDQERRARSVAQRELEAEDRSGVLERTFLLLRPGGFEYGRGAFILTHAGNSSHTVTRMARLPEVFQPVELAQYDSEQMTTNTTENGIIRTMGRTRICCDNPMATLFLAALRNEFYYGRVCPTKAQAKRDVGAWIGATTTGAAGTPQSARSAPSRSRCGTPTTPGQHVKPHRPVLTVGVRASAPDSSEQSGGTGGHAPGWV